MHGLGMGLMVKINSDSGSGTLTYHYQYQNYGFVKGGGGQLYSFRHNFLYIVLTAIKYRGSAICNATPFVVNSNVVFSND